MGRFMLPEAFVRLLFVHPGWALGAILTTNRPVSRKTRDERVYPEHFMDM